MKVAVLGAAGGIGQALALLLKTQLPSGSELSLNCLQAQNSPCTILLRSPQAWRLI